ncbi:Hemolysin, contains CBS domains [Sanguibacter gelidistatuariae]|uniref:Hemolysin, contains CBS domains n=1 Tax=Sanguibacter gelidistatuariae TaxID=1814289 RepID=A0A1G6VPW7_9MICO|nr:hemolysin family protein [Sanguibacter gelidistatuariae]SDD55652.1 Hemolysin, contains CBS domains [Sanguibacter gelidistatuariae]
MTEWLLVGLGVLLTLGTAVFVASEFALVTLDPAVVGADDEGPDAPASEAGADRRTRSVRYALKHLSTELSSAQVGITITTILLGYTAQPAIKTLIEGALGGGSVITATTAGVLAVAVSVVVVNFFSMLFGELIPKNFALSRPLGTARLVVPVQRVFTRALRPLIAALNGSANVILRGVGVEPKEELSGARSASELAALVRRSAQVGTLDSSMARLLTNAVELDELTAGDVMTDRMRVAVVSQEDTASAVIELARRTGHSRFPVIGDSRDDIVGLVHLRKAVAVPRGRRDQVPAVALMDEAPRVPETVRLGPLLVELRSFGLQMAVVVDEYGGTSGVVTFEDVVEELVGDVADEHDPRRVGALRATDGSWVVPGLLRPDELEERTGMRLPEEPDYETLGGLVMARLGRIPVVGDTVRVDSDLDASPVTATVEAMDGRRVERLRLRTKGES